MKKIISISIALLLVLPFLFALDNLTTTEDLGSICSKRSVQVKEGDTLSYCNLDITISSLSSTSIMVNGVSIPFESDKQFEGVQVAYKEFSAQEATIELSSNFEKHLDSFENKKFKLFYKDSTDQVKLVGNVDIQTETLAQIKYGTNTAYIRLRSSTPEKLTFGIDFVNEDESVQESIQIPWNIEHTLIKNMDSENIQETENPTLFQSDLSSANQNTISFTVEGTKYTIKPENTPNQQQKPAISLSSTKSFFVVTANKNLVETKNIWLTTKLAGATAVDEGCIYDLQGASLDDFTRRSSVQGYYSSLNNPFDVFSDYCKDENTLVSYGCISYTQSGNVVSNVISRVTFLETTCKTCLNGACVSEPYCIDSDKNARNPNPYYVKGNVKILKNGPSNTPKPYDDGMKKTMLSAVFNDSCAGNILTEYSCSPNAPGYTMTSFNCTTAGAQCSNGACVGGNTQSQLIPNQTISASQNNTQETGRPETSTFGANLGNEINQLDALIATLQDISPGKQGAASISASTGSTVVSIELGGTYTCLLTSTKEVYCWGKNDYGQLGLGSFTITSQSVPTKVSMLSEVTQLTAGDYHVCAVGKVNGIFGMYCWGNNVRGELGDGSFVNGNPSPTKNRMTVTATTKIAAGASHTCATNTSGMYCWGLNDFGQLGNGSQMDSNPYSNPYPTKNFMTNPTQITAGSEHTCAVNNVGMYCWGRNNYGEIGDGSAGFVVTTPTKNRMTVTATTKITSGASHTCATNTSGMYCWGSNGNGEIGNGSRPIPDDSTFKTYRMTYPTKTRMTNPTQITAGGHQTCATNTSGMYCWGYSGSFGQLGNGSTATTNEFPTKNFMTNPTQIASGYDHTCATNTSGMYCWGLNNFGQLGDYTIIQKTKPTKVKF